MALEETIKSMVESAGLQLYDIELTSEFEQTIYRVYITSQDGVNLDQCTQITHLISPLLDVQPPVSGDYRLEVSSPGIERKLKKLSHYQTSIGEKVKCSTNEAKTYIGKLISVDGNIITLDDEAIGEVKIDFTIISKARTVFDF